MEAGIVGLPFIGKTSLFNALTALGVGRDAGASAAKPNVGVVNIPDPRLDVIQRYVKTKKVVSATMQLVDVAGLVSGASKGEGLGNRFLGHVRGVGALLHVVRCFEDPNVPHVDGSVDPVRDIEEVETELMLADLEQVEGMMDKARKQARTGVKEAKLRLSVIEACQAALAEGRSVSTLGGVLMESAAVQNVVKSISLLSAIPVLYVANVGEDDLEGESPNALRVRRFAAARGGTAVALCAKLEAELVELDASERQEMREGMGLTEPALAVLARAAYGRLGMQSFFTAGPKEIRAWAIPNGATAP
ncbi:MAG: redox-regulated ATPase YchF, partial [Pirellulaceae bacterium]|nr:redox-regulated ATPase YchF [Pirellulaceae bacterium]